MKPYRCNRLIPILVSLVFVGVYCIYSRPISLFENEPCYINMKCEFIITKADLENGRLVTESKRAKLTNDEMDAISLMLNKYQYRRELKSIFSNTSPKVSDGYTMDIIYFLDNNFYRHIVINEDGLIWESNKDIFYHIGFLGRNFSKELFSSIYEYSYYNIVAWE